MTFTITEDRPPVLLITEECRRAGCAETFTLAYDRPMKQLAEDLFGARWSLHPSLGWVCPAHEYGIPVAALPAAPVDRPTAPFQAIKEAS